MYFTSTATKKWIEQLRECCHLQDARKSKREKKYHNNNKSNATSICFIPKAYLQELQMHILYMCKYILTGKTMCFSSYNVHMHFRCINKKISKDVISIIFRFPYLVRASRDFFLYIYIYIYVRIKKYQKWTLITALNGRQTSPTFDWWLMNAKDLNEQAWTPVYHSVTFITCLSSC